MEIFQPVMLVFGRVYYRCWTLDFAWPRCLLNKFTTYSPWNGDASWWLSNGGGVITTTQMKLNLAPENIGRWNFLLGRPSGRCYGIVSKILPMFWLDPMIIKMIWRYQQQTTQTTKQKNKHVQNDVIWWMMFVLKPIRKTQSFHLIQLLSKGKGNKTTFLASASGHGILLRSGGSDGVERTGAKWNLEIQILVL